MKKSPFLLLLTLSMLSFGQMPDFGIRDVMVLPDGFIALRIENSSSQDFALPVPLRDSLFLSLAINGVKRAEYKSKAIDPTIFLKNSFIVFKTNFRVGRPLRIKVELNGEKAIPETDFSNNVLEKELRPES